MAEKYIRVSNYLHESLKIKGAKIHMTLRDLAESYIWEILRKDENVIEGGRQHEAKKILETNRKKFKIT